MAIIRANTKQKVRDSFTVVRPPGVLPKRVKNTKHLSPLVI